MALNPASKNASRRRNDVASSAVQPKTLPPKTSGAIESPVRPRFLFSMGTLRFDVSWLGRRPLAYRHREGRGSLTGRGPNEQVAGRPRIFRLWIRRNAIKQSPRISREMTYHAEV